MTIIPAQPTMRPPPSRRGRIRTWTLALILLVLVAVSVALHLAPAASSARPEWLDCPAPAEVVEPAAGEPDAPDGAQGLPKSLEPEPVHPLVARNLARRLASLHITRMPLNDVVATRALDLFLAKLDYDRSTFLASDVEEFRRETPKLAAALRGGNLAFAFRAFALYKTRLRNRTRFVENLLDQSIDFEVEEWFAWKRRDAAWPATPAEWDDLWRRKIKNDVVARMVARRFQEEEKRDEPAGTNGPPAEPNAAFREWEDLSPAEFVRKRFQQQLMVIEDHESEWVVQTYLSSYAQAYDPHTEYMSPAASEDFDIDMKLSLSGVGAVLAPEDGFPKIVRIIPGGPAETDGRLKPGDRIVAVAQGDEEPVDIFHWPLARAVRLIRGPRGTRVVLSVIAAGDISGRIEKVDLVRDEVKLEEEAAKSDVREIPGPDGAPLRLGVLRLPQFYADMRRKSGGAEEFRSSAQDIRRALLDLNEKQVAGILFDLRNNGGGALGEAVEMTGYFLEGPRRPVVQVKESWRVNTLNDPDPGIVFTGAVVVLVNRQSASASEILAAALQDYGRAVLVGDSKTHGKGTVQSLTSLSDFDAAQGSLKVTAATFHRVGGGSTQLKGVKPDIVIPSPLEALEIGEEFLPHPLPWSIIPAVPFTPVANLQPALSNLAARSAARLAADPRFAARLEQIQRLEALHRKAEIPLRLEDRLALARSERTLIELQEQNGDEPDAAPPPAGRVDLVEEEALRILADLLAGAPPPGADAPPATSPSPLPDPPAHHEETP